MDALNGLLQESDIRLNEVAKVFERWCDRLEDWSNSIESQYPYLTNVVGVPVIFVFLLPLVSGTANRETERVKTEATSDHGVPAVEILSQRKSALEMCNYDGSLQSPVVHSSSSE